MGGPEPGVPHPGIRRLVRLGIEVAHDDQPVALRSDREPVEQLARLVVAQRLVLGHVVEVGDGDDERRSALERDRGADRGPLEAQVEPLGIGRLERPADQERVPVLRPSGPPARALVAALAARTDQAILLERIDDLLQAEDVRLEGGHVGQEQRQPLVPPVGEVADVQGGDVERGHVPKCARRTRSR